MAALAACFVIAGPCRAAPEASETSLGTITVNARGREEAAQEVPIPITMLDGETLETQQLHRLEDMQQMLPSTSIDTADARQAGIAVRGIGRNPANDGLEGSTGIYLDNVYLGRAGMASFDLLDIERIELLRGPQGTLFGKNTTAGVLSIHTRAPAFETERSLQLSLGQRGLAQGQAVFSGALSDDVAGRLLVHGTHDRGSITNLHDGGKLDGGVRAGVRGQLLVRNGDAFSLRLIADYHRERSSYGTRVIYGLGPGLALARAQAGGATGITTDPRRREVNIDGDESVSVDQGGLSAEAAWKLASGATLTSITAGRSWKFRPSADDNLNIPVLLDGGARVRQQQFSQELRLAGPAGGAVDHVIGAFCMRQRMRNETFTISVRVPTSCCRARPFPCWPIRAAPASARSTPTASRSSRKPPGMRPAGSTSRPACASRMSARTRARTAAIRPAAFPARRSCATSPSCSAPTTPARSPSARPAPRAC